MGTIRHLFPFGDLTMKIKVVKHMGEIDFSKTGEVYFIEVFVGNMIIAEFYDFAEYRLDGFIEGLKYCHGKKLEIKEEILNDYSTGIEY